MVVARKSTGPGAAERVQPYPPIADYALIGDCHSSALVSRTASIDWCCMPRFDSASVFGRMLDWKRGGYCSIRPTHRAVTSRRYLEGTLVLVTTFQSGGGEARLYDCFTMRRGGADRPARQLLRIAEGLRGNVDFRLVISPRFDYGEVRPWIRQHALHVFSAIGCDVGLVFSGDLDLEHHHPHDLGASFSLRPGQRARLSIQFVRPEILDEGPPPIHDAAELDRCLGETMKWWERWSAGVHLNGPHSTAARRSAIVLKGLTNAPTGAIAAAPTTSLPESPGGGRNWDYRYSWIRDSIFTVRSLVEMGRDLEADGFRRFIERSAAGTAEDLQIMYGLGGERRLLEFTLELDGYGGARPVRVGNAASTQLQLDAYGMLLFLAYEWHRRGRSPDDDYWRFLVELVEAVVQRWPEPDSGIWEVRGARQHFVHSKASCWVALNLGHRLAQECSRAVPQRRWARARRELRAAIEAEGYDKRRGVFVRSFGSRDLDSALLLLPVIGFVDWTDERMIRTTEAIREDLEVDGLLLRYRSPDGLKGEEGAFLSCTFWLAECLARQGRWEEARAVFDRVTSTANDLGLFAEEFDPATGRLLGNFPQGLTHLSHIAAAVALADGEG